MAAMDVETELAPYRAAVKDIGDKVRQLKVDKADENDIKRAVNELKARKKALEDKELELRPKEPSFDRLKLEDLLKRRFFYDQSFAIYGGVAGLYDYGPMGCALKSNMIQIWRKHFILEEAMLEVECSALTPENVLKASGHVDRFVDWMVKDEKTGECFRADHLIKNSIEEILNKDKKLSKAKRDELDDILVKLDGFSSQEMGETIKKFGFKSPITKNNLTEPVAFNLMFPTQIGPTGDFKAFLRPETAQGIFINFKRLLEFNQGRLPFAAAQVGSGFRNEISPRQGLIRVREFTMCEIEHFLDPMDKDHPRFKDVADLEMNLFSACDQMDGKGAKLTKIGVAVKNKVVDNETLGYYMARTYLFLINVGVDPSRLRFRQHMSNEMAHYAQDCWDAECLTSYGWIECVGNADRSCYDLQAHAKVTNERLTAEKKLPKPTEVTITKAHLNKQVLGKKFRGDAKVIAHKIEGLEEKELLELGTQLATNGKYDVEVEINGKKSSFTISADELSIKQVKETKHVQEIFPSVVEPSFGIGRIMYVVLEHAFRVREGDEQRNYLELPPIVSPIKCSLLPISANEKLNPLIEKVRKELSKYELSHKLDDSAGSIGRRYARTDEIGIPFGITVDFESEKIPHTVTLRHAPTMQQIRLEISQVGVIVSDLVHGRREWPQIIKEFPLFTSSEN